MWSRPLRPAVFLLCALILSAGCSPRPLYIPEVQVRPAAVGYGGEFAVRILGTAIARYRFLGATPGPGGLWTIRLDPIVAGAWSREATVTARAGDTLPLGPRPAVLVEFMHISPTQLDLRAVAIHSLQPRE